MAIFIQTLKLLRNPTRKLNPLKTDKIISEIQKLQINTKLIKIILNLIFDNLILEKLFPLINTLDISLINILLNNQILSNFNSLVSIQNPNTFHLIT